MPVVAETREIGRDLDEKRRGDRDPSAGRKFVRQDQLDDVDILRVGRRDDLLAIHREIQVVDKAVLPDPFQLLLSLAERGQLPVQGGVVVFVPVGPEMEPDISEGIGRMVDILQGLVTAKGMVRVVEGHADMIMNFLLPVFLSCKLQAASCKQEEAASCPWEEAASC
jgi:hypothetical protein